MLITLFYVSSALFPWLVATAAFAFFFGRAYGIEVGKLSHELDKKRRREMRANLLAELKREEKAAEFQAEMAEVAEKQQQTEPADEERLELVPTPPPPEDVAEAAAAAATEGVPGEELEGEKEGNGEEVGEEEFENEA